MLNLLCMAPTSVTPAPLCRKVLEKYEIGALEESAVTTSYEIEGEEDEFYSELKDAANMYFKTNKACAPKIYWVLLALLWSWFI